MGIVEFVKVYSQLEYGVINHALCAAIRDYLRVCYVFSLREKNSN